MIHMAEQKEQPSVEEMKKKAEALKAAATPKAGETKTDYSEAMLKAKEGLKAQGTEVKPVISDAGQKAKETDIAIKEEAKPPVAVIQAGQEVSAIAGEGKVALTNAGAKSSEELREEIRERREQLRQQHKEMRGHQMKEPRSAPPSLSPEARQQFDAEREARRKEFQARGEHRGPMGRPGREPPGRTMREGHGFRGPEQEPRAQAPGATAQEDPTKVLAMRFAKGEITEEEYKKRLAVLKESNP